MHPDVLRALACSAHPRSAGTGPQPKEIETRGTAEGPGASNPETAPDLSPPAEPLNHPQGRIASPRWQRHPNPHRWASRLRRQRPFSTDLTSGKERIMTTSAQTQRGRNRLAVLVALSLAAFIISLDVTIVNVALPTLVRTLGATTTQLQWVVDAYSLVFAAFVLAAGSLSDRQGRKGTLLSSVWPCSHRAVSQVRWSTRRPSSSRSRRDGPWRRPHVPVHPLAAGERLHRARRACQGHRALGCHDWSGDRHGSNCGWLAVGALLVGKHLRVHGRGRPRHWTPRRAGSSQLRGIH